MVDVEAFASALGELFLIVALGYIRLAIRIIDQKSVSTLGKFVGKCIFSVPFVQLNCN